MSEIPVPDKFLKPFYKFHLTQLKQAVRSDSGWSVTIKGGTSLPVFLVQHVLIPPIILHASYELYNPQFFNQLASILTVGHRSQFVIDSLVPDGDCGDDFEHCDRGAWSLHLQ